MNTYEPADIGKAFDNVGRGAKAFDNVGHAVRAFDNAGRHFQTEHSPMSDEPSGGDPVTATDAADWPARLRALAVRVRVDVAQRGQPADVPLASTLAAVLEERATLNWSSVAPPGWIHAPALLDAVDRLAEVLAAALDDTGTTDDYEGTAP